MCHILAQRAVYRGCSACHGPCTMLTWFVCAFAVHGRSGKATPDITQNYLYEGWVPLRTFACGSPQNIYIRSAISHVYTLNTFLRRWCVLGGAAHIELTSLVSHRSHGHADAWLLADAPDPRAGARIPQFPRHHAEVWKPTYTRTEPKLSRAV